jgi:hypothetical protein
MNSKWITLILLILGGVYLWRNRLMIGQRVAKQIAGTGVYEGSYRLIGEQKQLLPPRKETLAITLTVGSSPIRLPYGRPVNGKCRFTALSTNAGSVFIGDSAASVSSGPRYTLEANDSQDLAVEELSSLYYGGTAGDSLSVFCEIQKQASVLELAPQGVDTEGQDGNSFQA